MDRSQGREQPARQQPAPAQQEPGQQQATQPRASHLTPPDPLLQPAALLPNVRQEHAPSEPPQALGYRPHPSEVGRDFQIHHPGPESGPLIGKYVGPGTDGQHLFDVHHHGQIPVPEDQILGYRPTVGGMHPPGQVRPPEENLDGRPKLFLSEADLSGAMARQRKDPDLAEHMAVTTFGATKYENFETNRRNLEALGVPVVPDLDISKTPETARRLSALPSGANLHFQMPNAGRGKYSTKSLVRDTLSLPKAMDRDDISVSITAPDPGSYKRKSSHRYGLENREALEGTDMKLKEEGSDSDGDLEKFGYEHKQTHQDASASVAAERKKYKFTPRDSEHEELKNAPKGSSDRDDESWGGGEV